MWLSCDLSCDLHLTASLGDKALHKELWHFNQGKWVTLVQSQLYQTSHFSLPSSPPSSPLPRGTTRICSILLSASKRRTSWQTNSVSETFTLHNYTPAPTFYLSPSSLPPSHLLPLTSLPEGLPTTITRATVWVGYQLPSIAMVTRESSTLHMIQTVYWYVHIEMERFKTQRFKGIVPIAARVYVL